MDEAAHSGAQLPMLVRAFTTNGGVLSETVSTYIQKSSYCELKNSSQEDCIWISKPLYELFSSFIAENSRDEIEQVEQSLPKDLGDLWPLSAEV